MARLWRNRDFVLVHTVGVPPGVVGLLLAAGSLGSIVEATLARRIAASSAAPSRSRPTAGGPRRVPASGSSGSARS